MGQHKWHVCESDAVTHKWRVRLPICRFDSQQHLVLQEELKHLYTGMEAGLLRHVHASTAVQGPMRRSQWKL